MAERIKRMKVLGVDPGLNTSGYAVVERRGLKLLVLDAGTIKTGTGQRAGLSLAKRLTQIYHDIDSLLEEYDIDMMAVEQLYSHYKHPRTAILMGHARGIFLLAAARREIAVSDFSATRIKKSLTGNGRASKEQVQKAVAQQLKLGKIPQPADVADALAVAVCAIDEQGREARL